MINFQKISITGLFGRIDVSLPINDNRLIIVGNNGIGKSTILNAFYYFTSLQWEKLRDIEFETIKIHANDEIFSIKKEWIPPPPPSSKISNLFSTGIGSLSPLSLIAKRNYETLSDLDVSNALQSIGHIPQPELHTIGDYFKQNLNGKILYLPTYRRIEKDIKSIFPEIDEKILREIWSGRATETSEKIKLHTELVNFGMDDVNYMIEQKMRSLRGLALSEIRSLSTKYLRDVIRNEANIFHPDRVRNFGKDDLERMFSNIDEDILNQRDQDEIYHVVEKIKNDKEIQDNEGYVAHYISSLIDIWERINTREESIHEFMRICDSYLFDKRFRFDNSSYSLPIEYNDGGQVSLENLSSGEKQIVSIFAHMILDDNTQEINNQGESSNSYVIIDEPELSLSVDWQQKFLQDISNLDSCAFVGAVTHSPFVFENDLEKYAVDMVSCIKR